MVSTFFHNPNSINKKPQVSKGLFCSNLREREICWLLDRFLPLRTGGDPAHCRGISDPELVEDFGVGAVAMDGLVAHLADLILLQIGQHVPFLGVRVAKSASLFCDVEMSHFTFSSCSPSHPGIGWANLI